MMWIFLLLCILFLCFKISGGIAYASMKKPLAEYDGDFNEDFATKAVDIKKGYNRPALIRAGSAGTKLSKTPIHHRQIQGYENCRTFDKDGEDDATGKYLKLYIGRPYEGYRSRVHKNDTKCSYGKKYSIPGMAIPGLYDAECLCEPKAGVNTKDMYKTFLPIDGDDDYYKNMGALKRFFKGAGIGGN